MIQEETEKVLRALAENNKTIAEILSLNDELNCIAGAMRLSYSEALKNNSWEGYKTLKDLKNKKVTELYKIKERSVFNA